MQKHSRHLERTTVRLKQQMPLHINKKRESAEIIVQPNAEYFTDA